MSNKNKVLVGLIVIVVLMFLGVSYYKFFANEEKVVSDIKTYSVVLVVDENNQNTIKINENEKVKKPTDPTKNGYIFDNWYVDNKVFDFNIPITENLTIRAKWNEQKELTVKFDTDGGDIIADQIIPRNEQVVKPKTAPVKKGYTFVEWQLDGETYDFNSEVTTNFTLKALWKNPSDLIKYTVTFDSKGGSAVAKKTVVENKVVTKPTNPTKSGYTFVEWQLDGKTYNFSSKVIKNITLNAIWKERKKVTITFDSKGGSAVASKTIYEGEKLSSLETPTKSEFTFLGWYIDTTKIDTSKVYSKSETLTASWIDNDQLALNNAKSNLKPIEITKGGQSLSYTATGCTSVVTPKVSIAKIKRDTIDKTIDVTIALTCGKFSETVTGKGVIKQSPYSYVSVDSGNHTNYNVSIENATNYVLYKTGTSTIIGVYASTGAVVSASNIETKPIIDMIFDNDQNTTYLVSSKN